MKRRMDEDGWDIWPLAKTRRHFKPYPMLTDKEVDAILEQPDPPDNEAQRIASAWKYRNRILRRRM